jgi:dipeptidyl aminopeptidase/acylaminoacyl peptidase
VSAVNRIVVVLAFALAFPLAFHATARPYTVDDMLKRESFGDRLVSPDGRWLVFAREIAYERAAAFHFNSMAVQRSRLYRVDLAHPGVAQPLLPIETSVATVAYAFSPDGRRLAIGRLDGQTWRLGVVTTATGSVRWFDVAPEFDGFRTTLAWISDDRLVTLATPDASLPWLLDLDTRSERETAQAWRDQEKGKMARVTAIGSGAARGVTPDYPDMALVLVDADAGTTRTLTRGPYQALAASPDGHFVAATELRELVAPDPDQSLAEGTDPRRRRLAIVSIDDGRISHPCPACDLSYAPLAWSPSGDRLAFLARDGGLDWTNARVWVADAADQGLRSLPLGSVSPDLGGYPMTWARATIDWFGQDPLLLGRASDSAPRSDWYRLGDAGPVKLTGRIAQAMTSLVHTADGGLLVGSGETIWALGRDGVAEWASGQGELRAIAASALGAIAPNRQLARVLPSYGAVRIALPGGQRASSKPIAVSGYDRVDPVAIVDQGRTLVAIGSDTVGNADLFVQSGDGPRTIAASIDRTAGGAELPRHVALHYRLADGTAAIAWMYLPLQPETARFPLIVMPYSGRVYDGSALKPDDPAFDVGITDVEVITGHGYGVLLPSMPPIAASPTHPPDYAGQVMPAVDAAIATGFVDPRRLGLWGHSFGGYNGSMILTQTDRFAAALAANSLYDLASAVGSFMPWTRIDPGQGQSILAGAGWAETGQPSMGTTPWANPQAYVANSVLYRAGRIRTPLMILASDRDVGPLEQGEMLFSALFRQDKDAELLSYWGENHVLRSPANLRDFYARAFAWFDSRFARAIRQPPPVETMAPYCPPGTAPTSPAPSARPSAPAAAPHKDRCA